MFCEEEYKYFCKANIHEEYNIMKNIKLKEKKMSNLMMEFAMMSKKDYYKEFIENDVIRVIFGYKMKRNMIAMIILKCRLECG